MLASVSSLPLWGFSCLAMLNWPLHRPLQPFSGPWLLQGCLDVQTVLTAAPAMLGRGVPGPGSSVSDIPPTFSPHPTAPFSASPNPPMCLLFAPALLSCCNTPFLPIKPPRPGAKG